TRRRRRPGRGRLPLRQLLVGLGDQEAEVRPGEAELAGEVLGAVALALGEELAEEAPGPPLGEPARAEALPEVLAQRGLEAPRAQVVHGIEALVDVREPAALWPRDAQGVREEPLVAVGLAVEGARAVEPELVLELRRVAAHEVEAQGRRLAA